MRKLNIPHPDYGDTGVETICEINGHYFIGDFCVNCDRTLSEEFGDVDQLPKIEDDEQHRN